MSVEGVSRGREGGEEGGAGPLGEVLVSGERRDLAQGACSWERADRMTPDSALQIGSYFGASLCSVDVNGDSSSDLVLIGAPHFYEQMRGGQVSVCPFPRGVSSDETRARWGLAVGWKGRLG